MSRPPTAPALHGIAHVALTVRDVESSQEWYERVLGLEHVITVPHVGGEGVVLADVDRRVWWALHRHDGQDGARFTERRTGLDHVGLLVDSTATLQAWVSWLGQLGVEHDGITDLPDFGMQALVFRDPDGIPLELVAYV